MNEKLWEKTLFKRIIHVPESEHDEYFKIVQFHPETERFFHQEMFEIKEEFHDSVFDYMKNVHDSVSFGDWAKKYLLFAEDKTYGHSTTIELSKKYGISSFSKEYILPENLSRANFEKLFSEHFNIPLIMDSVVRGEELYGFHPEMFKNSGNYAKKWLSSQPKEFLNELNLLNNGLVHLNSSLSNVKRDMNSLNSEIDFACGVFYGRNPYDIDWFLKTRYVHPDKRDGVLDKTNHMVNVSSRLINEALKLNGMDPLPKLFWVVSPKTVESVLYELGHPELWTGTSTLVKGYRSSNGCYSVFDEPSEFQQVPWMREKMIKFSAYELQHEFNSNPENHSIPRMISQAIASFIGKFNKELSFEEKCVKFSNRKSNLSGDLNFSFDM